MKFGAVLPTQEIGTDPLALRDFAQGVEGMGFSHLLLYDHVLGAVTDGREPALTGPYSEQDPFHEPFVLFGYLAALTTRIEFTTAVLVLPQRQTALVAKQAAELSLLSGGRLRLGVGTGWNYVEYEALGIDYARRGARLSEQINLLRSLWREPVVDFTGQHHRVDRAGISPRPEAPIPIWCGGGRNLAPLRRAARVADGFLFGLASQERFEQAALALDLVEEAGRDRKTFGLETLVDITQGEAGWEQTLDVWSKLGGTHFSVQTISAGAPWRASPPSGRSPNDHLRALERFASALAIG